MGNLSEPRFNVYPHFIFGMPQAVLRKPMKGHWEFSSTRLVVLFKAMRIAVLLNNLWCLGAPEL